MTTMSLSLQPHELDSCRSSCRSGVLSGDGGSYVLTQISIETEVDSTLHVLCMLMGLTSKPLCGTCFGSFIDQWLQIRSVCNCLLMRYLSMLRTAISAVLRGQRVCSFSVPLHRAMTCHMECGGGFDDLSSAPKDTNWNQSICAPTVL